MHFFMFIQSIGVNIWQISTNKNRFTNIKTYKKMFAKRTIKTTTFLLFQQDDKVLV